jgi:hypothetical protein
MVGNHHKENSKKLSSHLAENISRIWVFKIIFMLGSFLLRDLPMRSLISFYSTTFGHPGDW